MLLPWRRAERTNERSARSLSLRGRPVSVSQIVRDPATGRGAQDKAIGAKGSVDDVQRG